MLNNGLIILIKGAWIVLLLRMAYITNAWSSCRTTRIISSNANEWRLKPEATVRKSYNQKILLRKQRNTILGSVINDGGDDGERSKRVEEETWSWIKRVIIGMEFCPFAAKPCKEKRLHVQVVLGDDPDKIVHAVHMEMTRLQSLSPSGGSTTVIVTPDLYPLDFQRFYTFAQWMEEEVDYEGVFQTIAFHPKFEFEGSGSEGSDNYTNRSPYPMIHILAEDDVSRAVDSYGGDASRVWKRNVAFLEELHDQVGRENVERLLLRGEPIINATKDKEEIVRNILNILQ